MNNKRNGSFKSKKIKFTQVSNAALRDSRLSLKAKGLYSLIQSYITIDNFILYKNTLRKNCLEGLKSFESAWKELKESGYLVQEKHQNLDGTFYYIYDLLDTPNQAPKKEGMDKGGGGKRGVYNNTNLNNTDFINTEKNDNGILSNDENSIRPFPNSDVINAMRVYMTDLYVKKTGNQHPHLKPEQYKRVYDTLDSFCSDNDVNKCGLVSMMIAFLNSNIDSDWNINHFATEGILMNRFYEQLY